MADKMIKKLHGKVAIITGGASGIGAATARLFAAYGARAVFLADIQDDEGRAVAASIGADVCTYVHCDVADEGHVAALVDSAVAAHGRLDVMFANAAGGSGSAGEQTVLGLDLEALDGVHAVNASGAAACVKHPARAMVAGGGGGGGGSVVCTASVVASAGAEKQTDYVMSKHAVVGLVRSASLQLGPHGIRVNAVSPGAVATPALRRFLKVPEDGGGGGGDEVVRRFAESRRVLRSPRPLAANDVAEAVAFLASDEAAFVTGHNLAVDGGSVRRRD